jgi:chromate transporter
MRSRRFSRARGRPRITADGARVPLRRIAREWTRIGLTGFGGPPAHIALLRRLVVERQGWMAPAEFDDALAACNLLPGPASTQLAIFCAYRVGGPLGAIVGGLGFVVPAVAAVLALSLLFLARNPPLWVRGAGAGAGAAVGAVAARAGFDLLRGAFQRRRERGTPAAAWLAFLAAGAVGAALAGAYLVVVLLGCGLAGVALARERRAQARPRHDSLVALAPVAAVKGGYGALAWTALKVGGLAFGGGFVIVPLMQADAVHAYHWMTDTRFLDAVALGQITPGPVVATVAAVGYAAHGVAGGVLAAVVAFAPSFLFVLAGGSRFSLWRKNATARAFLSGAAPAAIGAIFGAAVVLAGELGHGWQFGVLAAAAVALLVARRGIVATMLLAGGAGVVAALLGASV